MICKYCGCETTANDGICSACKYNLAHKAAKDSNDIFSSSGAEVNKDESFHITSEGEAEIVFPKYEETSDEVPQYAPPRVSTEKRKIRPCVKIIAVVLAVGILFGIALLAGVFKTNTSRIKTQLESGKYDSAYSLFTKHFDSSGSITLNAMLKSRIKSAYEDYQTGEKEFEDLTAELATIKKMNVTELKKQLETTEAAAKKLKESKECFISAEKYYSGKNYSLAFEDYSKVIKDDPNYSTAQKKLEQSKLNFRNTVLSEAAEYVSGGDYTSGIKVLNSALVTLKKDELIEKRIIEYKKSISSKSRNEVIDTADAYSYKNDYAGAIMTLLTAIDNNEDYAEDTAIKNSLKSYRREYISYFEDKIEEYIKESNYESAGKLIAEAEKLVPDNSEVAKKKSELEGKIPVYLHSLTPSSKDSWKFGEGTSVDSFGSDHSSEINCIELNTRSTATYELTEKYSIFSCKLAASKNIDSSVRCRVKITATVGGEYRYRECEIGSSTDVQQLSVNVYGCTSLTISVTGEGADAIMFAAKLEY